MLDTRNEIEDAKYKIMRTVSTFIVAGFCLFCGWLVVESGLFECSMPASGPCICLQRTKLFREKSIDVEYLIGYEGNAFAFTVNIEEDLLSITSAHPMRKEAVNELLKKANGNRSIVEKLIAENKLIEVEYKDNKFYIRKL